MFSEIKKSIWGDNDEHLSSSFTSNHDLGKVPEIFIESEKVYFDSVKIFRDICKTIRNTDSVNCQPLMDSIKKVLNLLKKEEKLLLTLANAPYSFILKKVAFQEPSLIDAMVVIHGINVMIYSLKISFDIGVYEARLPYIGLAALTSYLDFLDHENEQLLQTDDVSKLRNLPKNSDKYIKKMAFDDIHIDSVIQLTQISGENPQVLSQTNLREGMYQYAMLIQLCRDFEILTHRVKYSPIEAMKKLRDEMDGFFHPDIIKMLFDRLSIYPLGSFVRLSSHETAKIVKINEGFIMRPVVLIVVDDNGIEKIQPSRIDLRERLNLYIKHPVIDEQLTEHFFYMF